MTKEQMEIINKVVWFIPFKKKRDTIRNLLILFADRFNNIDLVSFKNLYENYIRSNNYGIYSKMNNLEIIIDNLVDKELLPKVEKIVNNITKNFEEIKNHVQNNEIKYLDNIVYSVLQEV